MRIWLFLGAFCLLATTSFAQVITEKGVGQVAYSGWGGPSAGVKQEAIDNAKANALSRYVASFTTAKMLNYEKVRSRIEGDIDTYVIDYDLLDELVDKEGKSFRVVVKASINTSLIDMEIQKVSAVENTPEEDRSYLSFVFVARKIKQRKQFDARKTTRVVEEVMEEQIEDSSVNDGQMGFASEGRTDAVRTTGGSTVQKSDEIEYDVSSAEDINAAMNHVFTSANYEVVEAEYLMDETDGLVDVNRFLQDFRYGDDVSGQTRRNAAKGCRAVGVQYFAIGTLDVGAKDIDPVSGMTRVHVSVNGKVMDLSGRFPKTVASVGPVQYAGMGPDQTVASRNALKLAGEAAAREIVSQLVAKGVR